MKILYITVPSFFDLEISLIRELSRNNDVKVILFLTPPSMKSSAFSIDKLSQKCALIDATEYIGFEQYKKLINLSDWIVANNPTNSILNAIKLSIKINRFIVKYDPDVVHFTNFGFNTIGSLISLNRKRKRILTIHDPEAHARQKLVNRILKRLAIKTSKNVLFLSEPPEPAKRKIAKLCKQIYYSALGPYDFLEYYIKNRPQNRIFDKYILFFGRIEHYKGVDILIESFKNSIASKNGYKLIIAGKGTKYDVSETENIRIINRYIENWELASLINNSTLVVLPYRSATQSGVIMSAFALNKPVIATNVGDFSRIISNGKYGQIIDPENPVQLKACIDSMTMDNNLLSKLSNNIEQDFHHDGVNSWVSIAHKLLLTYSSLE